MARGGIVGGAVGEANSNLLNSTNLASFLNSWQMEDFDELFWELEILQLANNTEDGDCHPDYMAIKSC